MFTVYALTIGGTCLELYNVENDFPFPHLININWLFLLLHGPLLWFYVKSLTTSGFKVKSVHIMHFVPFVFFSILQTFSFISLPAAEKILLLKSGEHAATLLAKTGTLAIGISSIGYNIIALFLLKKHLREIKNTFSNIEEKDLRWLKTFVIASLVIFSVNVLLYNLNNFLGFAEYFELAKIAYSFSTVYVLYIGYFGIRQGRIFADSPVTGTEQPVMSGMNVDQESGDRKDFSVIIGHLTRLMDHEQPYLDPELSLSKLSSLLKTKPEIVSEVLNSSLNQNFFDFINKHRIEEFKIKCLSRECRHLSIMGIAYECGFNSKAAFYRAFSKFEGMSPTAYISRFSSGG
jgi:AraC-like DNA-binding protein